MPMARSIAWSNSQRTPSPYRFIPPGRLREEPQDFIAQAYLELVQAVNRYAGAPESVREALIRARIRGALFDWAEIQNRHDSAKLECAECAGSGVTIRGDCPICGGRGFVFKKILDEIDGYRPAEGKEDPDYVYPLSSPGQNAEELAVVRDSLAELRGIVSSAVGRLPKRLGVVCRLAHMRDIGQCEIGARTGAAQSTVSRDLRGAEDLLRVLLIPPGVARYARARFRKPMVADGVLKASRSAGDWWGEMRARNGANEPAELFTCIPNNLSSAACWPRPNDHQPLLSICRALQPAPAKYRPISFRNAFNRLRSVAA